jgi:dimethylhistidine N-methyltransferase
MPRVVDAKALLLSSLQSTQASIPPRFFYDTMGCALYEAITRLPEYYPTRTERAIFGQHQIALAHAWPRDAQYIDLGSGDSEKAGQLLPLISARSYLAVDIARSAIESALPRLAKIVPHVRLAGAVTDFADSFDFDEALEDAPRVFVYPGSSIGNFTPDDAAAFLQRVRTRCTSPADRLLIGVDSVKDHARLNAAYDDALGVTAAFNLNVLRHVNHVIGSNFDVREWAHRGFFNETASRIEMHVEAKRDVTVNVGSVKRTFAAGERIHTENSYKYTRASFGRVLAAGGFAVDAYFTDTDVDFHVFLAKPT